MNKEAYLALIEAAEFVLSKQTVTSKGHGTDGNGKGCPCKACTEGPYLVHDRCLLKYVGNAECWIGKVQYTCTCGLYPLQKAVDEAKKLAHMSIEDGIVQVDS